MYYHIAPSILSADFAHLADDVSRVEDAGVSHLHLDVMDGIFVPNISFGPPVIASLRRNCRLFFDVHLMIQDPIRYIDDFIKAGADIITFHYESTDNPQAVIDKVKKADMKVGIAISPATPVRELLPYLDQVDMVLIMTVEPGFGGQSFMPEMVEKVRFVRRFARDHGLSYDVEVDGGISPETTAYVTAAGANMLVAGSAIFKSKKSRNVVKEMMTIAKTHPFLG